MYTLLLAIFYFLTSFPNVLSTLGGELYSLWCTKHFLGESSTVIQPSHSRSLHWYSLGSAALKAGSFDRLEGDGSEASATTCTHDDMNMPKHECQKAYDLYLWMYVTIQNLDVVAWYPCND